MNLYIKYLTTCFVFIVLSLSTIAQPTNSGQLHGTDTVCYSSNNGYLKLSFYLSDIQYWESSVSLTGPWNMINDTIDSLFYSGLTETTFFRVVLFSDTAGYDTSNVQTIYVSPKTEGGQLTGGTEVCAGANSTNLSLTNYTGSIINWEYSDNGGSSWAIINDTNSNRSINNLSVTTQYRVIVKSGACENDTSSIETITVYPQTNAGTISGDTAICYGANTGELVLSGQTGDIQYWEKSASGYAPWTTINTTDDTLSYTNLMMSYYYRLKVKSGVCSAEYSPAVQVEVSSTSEGGILSGSNTVCSEANNGTLVLSGHNGDVVKWIYSTDYGTSWSDTANINHTLNYSNLIQTTTYKAVVKSGVCPADSSENGVITVDPLPDVDFHGDSVCEGHLVGFINNSTISNGSIINYTWDFGNGQSSNSQNPSYTYNQYGTYTVQLTATSNKGCIDSTSKIIKIYNKPQVEFSAQNQCLNIPINFNNTSFSPSGNNLQYEWDFNDGTSLSNDTNPSHIFPSPGDYEVKLITEDISTTCKDSVMHTVSCYERAVPDFASQNVCESNESEFYNNSTISSGNMNYYWTFGDGGFSIDINPNHTYNSAGTYTVLLQVTSDKGCTDTISKNIHIHPVPDAEFVFNNICYTDTVNFIDSTSIELGTYTQNWDFGNGDTSLVQNPNYYYSSPGTYLVNLTVTSDSGCVDQAYNNIEVYSLPNVDFTFENSCAKDSVQFTNTSTIQSGTLNYAWEFGNGDTSVLSNPTMNYLSEGSYSVQLIVYSGLACADSVTKTIDIYPLPVADFNANNVCDGKKVIFNNNSTISSGTIQSFSWDFGDGTNSIQHEPEKQYLNPGTYNVGLDIISDNGCMDTVSHNITVDYLPVADFNIYNVCDKNPINPDNLSTITQGTMTYLWSFGDKSDSSIVPEPNHIYPESGLYPVTLRVYSENGCTDSLLRYVEIYSLPNANAGRDTSISKGQSVVLNGSGGAIYHWFPSTGLSNPLRSNPEAEPAKTTNYTLQVEDANGCIATDSVLITINEDFQLTPANILTPDGNGYNDTWKIENIESYPDNEVFVYDKWGNEVFYKKAYDNSWNGRNKNDDILPDGAYYYIIKFNESDFLYKGSVTILRNK